MGPFVSAEDLADTAALIRLEISEATGWDREPECPWSLGYFCCGSPADRYLALTLRRHQDAGHLHSAATTVAVIGSKAVEAISLIEEGDRHGVGRDQTYRHCNPEDEFQIVTQIAARSPNGMLATGVGTECE